MMVGIVEAGIWFGFFCVEYGYSNAPSLAIVSAALEQGCSPAPTF